MLNYKRIGQLMLLAGGIFALTSTSVYGNVNRDRDVDVRFTEGEGGGEVLPPITDPEVEIPVDPELPGGPLSIVHLMGPFSFGEIPIETGEQRVSVIASEQPLADGGGNTPYVDFIQVDDVRGTALGWQLQASLSDFTSSEEGVAPLKGVEIVLRDGVMTQGALDPINPEISLNNSVQTIMNAPAETNEQVSQVMWGDINQILIADEEGVYRNKSIELVIPTNVSPQQASYNATITWTLTPGEAPSE